MKTVLVTGATGLIGANICEQLIKQGDRVRTIARKPMAPDGLALRDLGVEVLPGDITDLACVHKATEGVDGVIHSAALRGLPGATLELSVGPNVVGTINTLTAAYSAGGIPVVQGFLHLGEVVEHGKDAGIARRHIAQHLRRAFDVLAAGEQNRRVILRFGFGIGKRSHPAQPRLTGGLVAQTQGDIAAQ